MSTSFSCPICFEQYTEPGTEHAICSTICGHIIGKSCMDEYIKSVSDNNLTCPKCRKKLTKKNGYHLLYDIPLDRLYGNEEGSISKFTFYNKKGELNLNPCLILNKEDKFDDGILIYDIHNEFLVFVTEKLPDKRGFSLLKLVNFNNYMIYSHLIAIEKCSSICINKFRSDKLEIMIGHEKGIVQTIFNSKNGLDVLITTETVATVKSICFLNENECAYSVGRDLFVANINSLERKENWARHLETDGAISNIQAFGKDCICGIMCNKLWVFKQFDDSYIIHEETKTLLYDFYIDRASNTVILSYGREYRVQREKKIAQNFVYKRLMNIYGNDTIDRYHQKYQLFTLKLLSSQELDYPRIFKPMFSPVVEGDFTSGAYMFVPNTKKNKMEGMPINKGTFFGCNLKVEDLDSCLTTCVLGTPKLHENDVYLYKILAVFKNKYQIYDFYLPMPNMKILTE
uniref:RING-type domain-containing protein n=1 Tax=Parastrongyloides trichosuri TaxID=131310 RepID=A0A0N4ZVC8_PARTI